MNYNIKGVADNFFSNVGSDIVIQIGLLKETGDYDIGVDRSIIINWGIALIGVIKIFVEIRKILNSEVLNFWSFQITID